MRSSLVLLAAAALAACNPPPEDPPDSGWMYVRDGGADAGEPVRCAEPERRCPRALTYQGVGDEASVEVRGDFAPGAWQAGVPMTKSGSDFTATVDAPFGRQALYKFFITTTGGATRWVEDTTNPSWVDDGNGGRNSVLAAQSCGDFTCASGLLTCPGGADAGFDWRDAVIYFAFVDRFANGDTGNDAPLSGVEAPANWQGGDWAGLKQKVEAGYFGELGVNALWITVPMDAAESPGSGDDGHQYSGFHGYWPRDLTKPERRFGTAAELTALVDAAHAKGLKVLVDYAMNHVHVDSPVWQQHMSDGWFHALNGGGGDCVCGSSVCPWDGPTAIPCWFKPYLPDFNFDNAQARAFSVGNAMDWMKTYQFDGMRLDAVKHIDVRWLKDLRARLTAEVEPTVGSHVYLVGETYTGDKGTIRGFIDPCDQLDGQFDFPLRAQLVSTVLLRQGRMRDLADFLEQNDRDYGQSVMSTFVGNHDLGRSIHFAQDTPLWGDPWDSGKAQSWNNSPGVVQAVSAYERLSVAYAVLFTTRGAPLLYYGDEVGLPGAGDPDNRRFMQWSGYNGGQTRLLERTKKLGTLRARHVALRRGQRTTVWDDVNGWGYRVELGSDVVWVLLNRGDLPLTATGLPPQGFTDELTGEALDGPTVQLPARSFRVMVGR